MTAVMVTPMPPGEVPEVSLRRVWVTPGDLALALRLLTTCDQAGVLARFGGAARPEANARWLLPRTAGDVALAATHGEEPMGWVNLARVRPGAYEVGILVADGWRGCGLGSRLVRSAVALAGDAHEIVGSIQPDNRPAIALLGSLARQRSRRRLDDGWLRFSVPADTLAPLP